MEEAMEWEEKARELDTVHQEEWRKRVSGSIVTSTWGGEGAQIDQMSKRHEVSVFLPSTLYPLPSPLPSPFSVV